MPIQIRQRVPADAEARQLQAEGWELPEQTLWRVLLREEDCWPVALTKMGPFRDEVGFYRYANAADYLWCEDTWYRSPIAGVSVGEIVETAWVRAGKFGEPPSEQMSTFREALWRVLTVSTREAFEAEQVLAGLEVETP